MKTLITTALTIALSLGCGGEAEDTDLGQLEQGLSARGTSTSFSLVSPNCT